MLNIAIMRPRSALRMTDDASHELRLHRNKNRLVLRHQLDTIVHALIHNGCMSSRFKVRLALMTEIVACLHSGTVKTKRDVYYQNTALYAHQRTVDTAVESIARSLGVPRDSLNIVAAPKGTVYGAIVLNRVDGLQLPLLIPRREEIVEMQLPARFVLVVEKDAVMGVIVQHYALLSAQLGPFAIVCGRGYPCLRTKQLLALIQDVCTPILVLVDHDPHGIEIALTYADAARIHFLGVTRADLDKHGDPRGLTPLTARDVKKISALRERTNTHPMEHACVALMENTRQKAEIEALYCPDSRAFCTHYLLPKLQEFLADQT